MEISYIDVEWKDDFVCCRKKLLLMSIATSQDRLNHFRYTKHK